MNPVDNNQFEVVATKSKRKIPAPCSNVYLNPALDLLANEDPMCNTAMEILPIKKRKRTKSCDIVAFENSALDLGISKTAINEFLAKELENVRKNIRPFNSLDVSQNLQSKMNNSEPVLNFTLNTTSLNNGTNFEEPIYANLSIAPELPPRNISIKSAGTNNNIKEMEHMHLDAINEPVPDITDNSFINANILQNRQESNVDDSMMQDCMDISKIEPLDIDSGVSVLEQKSLTHISSDITNLGSPIVNNTTNIQTNVTNQIFINNTPSNLSLSFIDRLALDTPNLSNQSLCLDDDLNESNIMEIKTITIITNKKRSTDKKKNTNPFLDPNFDDDSNKNNSENPFLKPILKPELEYTEYNEEALNRPVQIQIPQSNNLMPRRLFSGDTNSTVSTVDDSVTTEQNEYENIDGYESPIYDNVCKDGGVFNKQSKVLGYDVSQFSARDIMNLNKNSQSNFSNSSNESNESKKDIKYQILKASKLPKKVLKKFKKAFKGDKTDNNVTLNPYEVPRKPPKHVKKEKENPGIENPALNLDNSDEIEIFEEMEDDEEHQYETIKTLRNTRLNMNVTPLKEKVIDNADVSHNRTNTPGKKVRFDSTLNQEKIITGNSFDYDIQSPGFDSKIDKYHDELENCINERKFLQQNM